MSHRDKIAALTIPRLPRPRGGVDEIYVDKLVDALESAIDIINGSQFRTFSEINLSNTQGNGSHLRIGDVFEDSGTLKIVKTGDVFAASLSMTMSLGSVTVSTP
jgi:hypothetical protein